MRLKSLKCRFLFIHTLFCGLVYFNGLICCHNSISILGKGGALFSQYIEKIDQEGAGRLFKCKICGKTTVDRSNLKRHVENIHLPNSFIYTCNLCGESFGKKFQWNYHMKKQHS